MQKKKFLYFLKSRYILLEIKKKKKNSEKMNQNKVSLCLKLEKNICECEQKKSAFPLN